MHYTLSSLQNKNKGGAQMKYVAIFVVLCGLLVLGWAEEITLVWAEWWDSEWGLDTIEYLIKSFEAKYPGVHVRTVFAPWDQYRDKLLGLAHAGQVPDVMGMEVTWVTTFDRLGVLADWNTFIQNEPDFYNWYNPSWLVYWEGRPLMGYLYLIAYHVLYNVDLLASKGLEPPTSWEDYYTLLKQLANPREMFFGAALSFSMKEPDHFGYYLFWPKLIQAGGSLVDAHGYAMFNDDAGVRTLQYYKKLLDEGLVFPGTVEGALAVGEKEFNELLANGRVATTITGPFTIGPVSLRNPDIKLAFAPPFADVTDGTLVTGSGLAISSKTAYPELAWAFVKHLLSYEVARYMISRFSMPWANKLALEDPELQNDPVLGPMAAMIANPRSVSEPVVPSMDILWGVLLEHCQRYFLGEVSAQEALNAAAVEWNRIVGEALQERSR